MDKRKFKEDEIGLIARTMMQGATADDVAWFIKTCERTGLDPFARQIMPTSRNSRQTDGSYKTTWSSLTTIDGLRKIAVDSGDYEGQEGPWWCGEDGEWKEVWTDPKKPCLAAKVLVHRKNFKTGMTGIAKYASYVQRKKDGNPNNVWSQLGDHMTAKCAEALGLRRAYPNEMAGLYTDDEMEQVLQLEKQESEGNREAAASHTDGVTGFTATVLDQGWDIPAQETFAAGLEALYALYKQQDKNEDYLVLAEDWKKRMQSEGSGVVLADLGTFIEFMGLSFRLKTILKNGGKEGEYQKQHDKWAARLAKDDHAYVLGELSAFVTKCENAKPKGAK